LVKDIAGSYDTSEEINELKAHAVNVGIVVENKLGNFLRENMKEAKIEVMANSGRIKIMLLILK